MSPLPPAPPLAVPTNSPVSDERPADEDEFDDFTRSEASRAIGLMNAAEAHRGDAIELEIKACFVFQAVANLVGEASNTGVRGISWEAPRPPRSALYQITAQCVDGFFRTSLVAPPTLEEARHPEALRTAEGKLQEGVAKRGGRTDHALARSKGTSRRLVAVVKSTPEGEAWCSRRTGVADCLLRMVRIADAYGMDGVNLSASLLAHVAFIAFDDRIDLVRDYPNTSSARKRARELRGRPAVKVLRSAVKELDKRSGVKPKLARAILAAIQSGDCTPDQIKRAAIILGANGK